jgi:hypothetical protein
MPSDKDIAEARKQGKADAKAGKDPIWFGDKLRPYYREAYNAEKEKKHG